MAITALYAGALGLFFVMLAIRVIGLRRSAKVGLGDGGNAVLLRAIRVHGNFAEYAPFSLLLMALSEGLGAPALLLHIAGSVLLAGRVIHAIGVSRAPEIPLCRIVGMAATFTTIGILAVSALYFSLLTDPGAALLR